MDKRCAIQLKDLLFSLFQPLYCLLSSIRNFVYSVDITAQIPPFCTNYSCCNTCAHKKCPADCRKCLNVFLIFFEGHLIYEEDLYKPENIPFPQMRMLEVKLCRSNFQQYSHYHNIRFQLLLVLWL